MHTNKPNSYSIKLIRVIDGDTICADIYCPFKITLREYSIRLFGNDSHELYKKNHIAATAAKSALNNILKDKFLMIEVDPKEFDKYGRVLATVFYYEPQQGWINANAEMITREFATPALFVRGKYVKRNE